MAKQSIEQRFWRLVDRGESHQCWPWKGSINFSGYGRFFRHGIIETASRIAYELTSGAIAEGLIVMHSCDNPPCCNPAHLSIGTRADNARDRSAKKRDANRNGELNPAAKLTPADIVSIRADKRTQDAISRSFGVSQTTISTILRRSSWRHI